MHGRRAHRLLVVLGVVGVACAQNAAIERPKATPTPTAEAGGDEGVFAIVSSCGFRLVVNDGEAHFTVDLDGTVTLSEQQRDTPYFLVDDLIVQPVHVSHAQLGPDAAGKSGLDLLRAHAAWESAYIGKSLGVTVEPRELALESKGTANKLEGILWWFPLPDRVEGGGDPVHRYWAFATLEVGEHVVGLSARAERGLEPIDVMGRLARWVATLKSSETKLAPGAISAALRRGSEAADKCPAPETPIGIDHRLRLDELTRGERDGAGRAAEREGGVERQTLEKRLRYRNHACRFEFTYPDDAWKDFLVRDFSDEGCLANLATPLVYDPDVRQKITNAVVLTVNRASPGFGAADRQAQIVDTMKGRGARFADAAKPLLEGAVDVTYTAEAEGTHFVGEIATVRRGDLVYGIHFTSTRGSLGEGRKHLARWLAGLKLDVP